MESEALRYGGLGFGAIVVAVILAPIVRALIRELRDGRMERTEMRQEFMAFIRTEAKEQTEATHKHTEALHDVREGLGEVVVNLRALNGRRQEER